MIFVFKSTYQFYEYSSHFLQIWTFGASAWFSIGLYISCVGKLRRGREKRDHAYNFGYSFLPLKFQIHRLSIINNFKKLWKYIQRFLSMLVKWVVNPAFILWCFENDSCWKFQLFYLSLMHVSFLSGSLMFEKHAY